jgi:uncharacterized coiled-coil DUF342 family protein
MQRLTKAQWSTITTVMTDCEKAADRLNDAITIYNNKLNEARGDLGNKITEYNDSVSALKEVYTEFASQAQSYYDERDNTWKDSDAGYQYLDWIGHMEDPDGLEPLDMDLPEELEEPDLPDYSDTSWLPPEEPGE